MLTITKSTPPPPSLPHQLIYPNKTPLLYHLFSYDIVLFILWSEIHEITASIVYHEYHEKRIKKVGKKLPAANYSLRCLIVF
jgi:hypothetical protein